VDWVTFIVSETKALAWPAVVLVAVFVLKQQITGLISQLGSRLKTAKGAGIELSFGERIDEVENSLPPAELTQLAGQTNAKRVEEITDLSALPPAYVISQAWLRVEEEIERSVAMPVAISMVSSRARRLSPLRLLSLAADQELITNDEFTILDQLRNMRNQAAHSRNPDISLTDALRYNDIANSIVQQVKERAKARGNTAGNS
jgi:hypothetical protein